MRAYEVVILSEFPVFIRVAGSQEEASAVRRELIEKRGLKMKAIRITPVEIPTSKADLLAHLNSIYRRYDA